jgi:TPR repeat protein
MLAKQLTKLLLIGTLLASQTAFADNIENSAKLVELGTDSKALDRLIQLANSGSTAAQLRLGGLYYHGKGVPEDEVMALYWWKKASAAGNTEAMYQIRHAYLFGNQAAKSVADPDREAAVWFFQGASGGHIESAYTLGLLFIAGKGVVEDRNEALRWFRQAASKGHEEARKAIETTQSAEAKKPTKPSR